MWGKLLETVGCRLARALQSPTLVHELVFIYILVHELVFTLSLLLYVTSTFEELLNFGKDFYAVLGYEFFKLFLFNLGLHNSCFI